VPAAAATTGGAGGRGQVEAGVVAAGAVEGIDPRGRTPTTPAVDRQREGRWWSGRWPAQGARSNSSASTTTDGSAPLPGSPDSAAAKVSARPRPALAIASARASSSID
jgi:hypothetical protein